MLYLQPGSFGAEPGNCDVLACQGCELVPPDGPAKSMLWLVYFFFFSKQLRVAPVTLGGKAGQVFGVLMMISLSKPAQTINGFEMLIRRRA